MRFLASAFLTCTLVLGCALGLNAAVDPAGLLDGDRRAVAAARDLVAGNAIPLSNADDRRLQHAYAVARAETLDVLIMGSSRMMQIEASLLPGRKLYNASVSSLTLDDLLALAELFVERRTPPELLVIGIDPWLFDADPLNARWSALESQVQAMRRGLDLPPAENGREAGVVGNLLSLSYTRESVNDVLATWRSRAGQTGGDAFAAGTKRPDGSILYGAAYAGRNEGAIRADALADGRQYVNARSISRPFAAGSVATFEKLLAHIRRRGVALVLVLPPYHPLTHAHVVREDDGANYAQLKQVVENIAARTGARVAGDSDPAIAGCAADEFWDGVHPKTSCLHRIVGPVVESAFW